MIVSHAWVPMGLDYPLFLYLPLSPATVCMTLLIVLRLWSWKKKYRGNVSS
jgi:hypothetical protein